MRRVGSATKYYAVYSDRPLRSWVRKGVGMQDGASALDRPPLTALALSSAWPQQTDHPSKPQPSRSWTRPPAPLAPLLRPGRLKTCSIATDSDPRSKPRASPPALPPPPRPALRRRAREHPRTRSLSSRMLKPDPNAEDVLDPLQLFKSPDPSKTTPAARRHHAAASPVATAHGRLVSAPAPQNAHHKQEERPRHHL